YNFAATWDWYPEESKHKFAHDSRIEDLEEARRYANEFTLEGLLPRYKHPLLVIFGKKDPYMSWEDAEKMAREAPKGEFYLHPEGLHCVQNFPHIVRPMEADWLMETLAAA
ncbi:MAG: hypothetical protein JOZ39_09065, partial [Chloroflexi bacterium]|nr:hypothetical protein [Chloroflexota bacterium]